MSTTSVSRATYERVINAMAMSGLAIARQRDQAVAERDRLRAKRPRTLGRLRDLRSEARGLHIALEREVIDHRETLARVDELERTLLQLEQAWIRRAMSPP